jgi:hypothetical protein
MVLNVAARISRPHYIRFLVAASPLALAPVGGATEVLSTTAEVGARAAESRSALLVDNRSAGLSLSRDAGLGLGLSGSGLVVAFSETSLATITTVQSLVLKVVLGAAVAGRGAAAVEVTISSSSGASNTSLGVAADVDFGDSGGEGSCWRSSLLGHARLHGSRRGGFARRRRAGERLQASGGVAVVDSGTAPSVLATCSETLVLFLLIIELNKTYSTRSERIWHCHCLGRSCPRNHQTPGKEQRR